MEFKEIRSVIERSMRYNELFHLHQEKMRVVERRNQQQPKGFVEKSDSSFRVVPTKELCRVYLQKPDLLASKGVIDAQAKPPHRRFGRSYDQQNLKSTKLRHHRIHTSVDPLKPKMEEKKEISQRYFTPLGFSSRSHLGYRKKGKDFLLEKTSKEVNNKLCDGTTSFGQNKETVVGEVKSSLMVSTCRDTVAADVKFGDIPSSGFISKDKNDDCSNASPECQTNSEEAHQPSPVSVLEPMFYEDILDDTEDILSNSEDLDFQSLEKQLETLKSESESPSDGSGMEVSSDEESVLDSETKESKDIEQIGFLDTQQSRDSSYIDDILAEAVQGDKNWVPDKRDLAISPKIFEKLEKKYYAETYWKSSERRILFDRVKSSLVEILESFSATPTWKKPVSRRLGTALSTCALKQELWKVLAKQERRAKKKSLAKVPVIDIDEWIELETDDESVVCELESMIVDELLLAEVVSFM